MIRYETNPRITLTFWIYFTIPVTTLLCRSYLRRCGFRNSGFAAGLSSFRKFTRQAHARRQAGPRGTAPGRGPFALLHDALSLMMALRRHLRASPHCPRYTTGARNRLRTADGTRSRAPANGDARLPPHSVPWPPRFTVAQYFEKRASFERTRG